MKSGRLETGKNIQIKMVLLIAVFLVFSGTVKSQSEIKLYSPSNGLTIPNNMPNFSWQRIACDYFEVIIDGIKMGTVPSGQYSYVSFPLSFGAHSWKVAAVTGKNRVESAEQTLTIEDDPLSDLPEHSFLIRHGWKVKSSIETGMNGAEISGSEFNTESWASTSLPATVLTALVRNGIYPNPYIGTNNMQIPDMNDDFNQENDLLKFSHIPGKNPWKNAYWYRTEFEAQTTISGKHIWLNFGELNYKAQIWLNGVMIADTTEVIGMERGFRFEITSTFKQSGRNILAVAIYPPDHPGKPAPDPLTPLADPGTNMADGVISRDYTKWDVMGWDWQPSIRDRDMGITEDVFISQSDDIELQNLYVTSTLFLPDTSRAELTVSADLVSHSNKEETGVIQVSVTTGTERISFEDTYQIAPNSIKEMMWDKEKVEKLILANPKLWWPSEYGQQNLYEVKVSALTKSQLTSTVKTNVGLRQVETYIGNKERVYKINGREIYLKGGNWVIDMLLNWNSSRYEKEIQLTKNANLNILRIWGPTGIAPKPFYDAADKYGILIWQDFLNDFWGTFKNTPGYRPDSLLFETITTGIVKKYRNHPSLILWCGGNEGPNPRENMIANTILKKYDSRQFRHYLKQSDGDGLHGGGPYHTLEPKEYFSHRKLTGFSSEIGPSGIPVLQSIEKFMPDKGKTWMPGRFPLDGVWAYHDANDWPGSDTRKFSSYDNIVRNYYGAPDTTNLNAGFKDYIQKCQLVNYDVYRSSIESINRQLWVSTSGILLWKANSSWPSITWQVYDWYMQSHAGYYGTKKASELLHVQFNRDDRSVSFLNLLNRKLENIRLTATLYDSSLNTVWTEAKVISSEMNSALNSGIIVPESKTVEFLKLTSKDKNGILIADNFYWLNELNNFKALNSLPSPTLSVGAKSVSTDGRKKYKIEITNNGKSIAFMVTLKAVGKESDQELLPSFWTDNYLNLLPGESKTLLFEIENEDLIEMPVLKVSSFGNDEIIKVNLE